MKKSIFCLVLASVCLFNACNPHEICNPTPCKLVRIDDYRPNKPYSEPNSYEFLYDGSNRITNFIVTKKDFMGGIVVENNKIFYNSLGKPDSIVIAFGYFKLLYTAGRVSQTLGYSASNGFVAPFVEIAYTYDALGRMITRDVTGFNISTRNFKFEYNAQNNLKKTTFKGEGPITIYREFTYDTKNNAQYYMNANNLLQILYAEITDFTNGYLITDPLSKNNAVYEKTTAIDLSINDPNYHGTITEKSYSYNYTLYSFPLKKTNTANTAEYRTFQYQCSDNPKF